MVEKEDREEGGNGIVTEIGGHTLLEIWVMRGSLWVKRLLEWNES